jgi:uncharacterized protein (TIGR02172 family)
MSTSQLARDLTMQIDLPPNRKRVDIPSRLDGNTAPAFEKALDLSGIRELVLDFGECRFVSSAGIRVILRAFQHLSNSGGSLVACNISEEVYGVFELSGLSQIIQMEKKRREITINGVTPLSTGLCGECFRLDEETIVKLYLEGVDPSIAEQEKKYAKAAFVMGIPTAISYDVVACGNRTGVVFEMLDAALFSEVIRNDLGNLELHAQTLTNVLKTLHNAVGDPDVLPNMKARFREYLLEISSFLDEQENQYLLEKLESIPDADTCVHFDLHSSNLMIREGEPIIIDMGDFSIGHYLFDVGLMFTIYGMPELGFSELATKIPIDVGFELWRNFERHFFADKSAEEYAFFDENRYFFGSLRIIYTITFLPQHRERLIKTLKEFLIPKMMFR